MQQSCSGGKLGMTPHNTRVETIHDNDMDTPSLRRLNYNGSNRTMNMVSESDLLKGTDTLRELRRKRQIQSNGTENNILLSASLLEKKSSATAAAAESNKIRHVDSSRALARFTRGTKTVSSAQRAFSNNRTNKDQVPVGKESGNRLKIWLR